jgi:hypothetical protein
MEWNKDRILALLNESDTAVCRAVLAIYEKQTADEQATASTAENNGIGFNGADAGFGSSLAKQYAERGSLSPRQIACARKMMRKYANQLAEIANAKAKATAAPAPAPETDAPETDAEAVALAEAEAIRLADCGF